MAKKKTDPLFTEWNQVNEALKSIAKIDNTLKKHEANMNEDINTIKSRIETISAPLLEEKELLEKNIQEFVDNHKAEFTDKKTKEFTCGQVGYRKVSSITTRNVQAILEALKNNKMLNCIITKEAINKEELDKYNDASIEKVGAKRKIDDKFFYKIAEERIEG